VGVPRFVFTDFPLGNPAGRPYDASMQREIVEIGLETLESAVEPRTTLRTPFVWDETGAWKDEFMQLDPARMEHYRAQGEIRRAIRETVKAAGRLRGWTGGELYKP
jgi:D-proline reductase (dithiol) PrdB